MRILVNILVCLSVVGTATSQDNNEEEEDFIAEDYFSPQTLDVIVTAERIKQPRVQYPAAVHVLTDDTLDNVAHVHAAEALNAVPGVHIHRGSGLEHLTSIRSPVLTGGAGSGSFLYLQDGIPLRSAGFSNVNGLFEAHSELGGGLEVFKGPGSVFYGSNALHGVIERELTQVEDLHLIRRPPTLDRVGSSF